MRELLLVAGFAACVALAQDVKPDLTGNWQLDPAKSEMFSSKPASLSWLIQQKGDTIAIKQVEKDGSGREKELASVSCGIGGKECDFKEPDGSAKASFWYNGPMLVEMKTHNDHVSKYRMKLGDDGKTLNVEYLPIVPPSEKPEHLVFSKTQ